MRARPTAVAVAALWALLASRLVILALVIPIWQNPDEPVHFAIVRALARHPSLDASTRRDLAVQGEILASMARHGWWEAYDEPVPNPVPTTFADLPTHLGEASKSPLLYYLLASQFCRLLGIESLMGQYYALRLASVLLTLLTLWVIVRAAREWFDDRVALCTGALVALVPQFALIGISVSPDPLVFLAGAFVWWQLGRVAAGKGVVIPVAMMIAATALAVLAKQIATPLVVQAGLLGLLAIVSTVPSRSRRRSILAGVLAVVIAVIVTVAVLLMQPLYAERFGRYLDIFGWKGRALPPGYFGQFTWSTFGTAYLAAGWLRYFPPASVVAVAFAVCLFGQVRALAIALVPENRRFRLGTFFALLFVAIQLGAIYGTQYYLPDYGSQGRFLFASIGPFAALCALGLVRWNSSWTRAVVCCGAIGLMAILDVVSWATTVIPAYAR